MDDERVRQLAETLKKQGLAVSMYEAMEKARSIIGVKPYREDITRFRSPEPEFKADAKMPEPQENAKIVSDYGDEVLNQDITLNELMKEIGVSEEDVRAQEQEKINKITEEAEKVKENILEAKQNPEKTEEVRAEIVHIEEELDKIIEEREAEEKTEGQEKPQNEDDGLSKAFNFGKE